MIFNIVGFHFRQIKLLRAKDRTRTRNTNPANEGLSRNLEILHSPKSNQSACSPKSSLTMNCNGTWILLSEMLIYYLHKLFNYAVWRSRSVDEKQVVVLDSLTGEEIFVILLFIQPDHPGYVEFFEHFNVFLGVVTVPLVHVSLLNGPHEGHESSWYDPVQIPVLDSLMEFIFFYIKCFEVVPFQLHCVLKALQNLQECTLVQTVSL